MVRLFRFSLVYPRTRFAVFVSASYTRIHDSPLSCQPRIPAYTIRRLCFSLVYPRTRFASSVSASYTRVHDSSLLCQPRIPAFTIGLFRVSLVCLRTRFASCVSASYTRVHDCAAASLRFAPLALLTSHTTFISSLLVGVKSRWFGSCFWWSGVCFWWSGLSCRPRRPAYTIARRPRSASLRSHY